MDGGYAELAVADERYCFPIPAGYDAVHAAPLLCAGLIGYRALRAAGDAVKLGLYGFGASAHIVAQVARHQGRRVFAFTRPGDHDGQSLRAGARGRVGWVAPTRRPPEPLDAAIIFAPAGTLVPVALRAVDRGGTVVCAGIHMSAIPELPYELLWGERVVRSIANLTRADGEEFFRVAAETPIDRRSRADAAGRGERGARAGAFGPGARSGGARPLKNPSRLLHTGFRRRTLDLP